MKLSFIILALVVCHLDLYAQNNVDYVGNYKSRSINMGNIAVKVDKESNAFLTIYDYKNKPIKFQCDCRTINQNTLGCYMVKLVEGKSVIFNPKVGEFVFAIIYENREYYPFIRGDQPPFTNKMPAEKLFIKKDAVKFIKSK